MIGTYGTTVFITSTKLVRNYDALNRVAAPRYAEHEIIGKKTILEFIAPGIETITFNMRLDITHGVNPDAEYNALAGLRDSGKAEPLLIGGRFLGNFVVLNLSLIEKITTNKGKVMISDLAVTLKELADGRA